ncbi:BgTH12-00547 [Blumeria graminis f. sp. triticale]|uniref:BgTH12-00547 n=1 Tax=Blumeria graminis f. sp. triticale TaxID=1689686 RepID=A0A9W4D6H1_BLUGR|nr:BgTH12-00547 [Blumeria graminis f. sp. triticale]
MSDSISIEETNRIRISLGMRPLPVPNQSGPVFEEAPAVDAGSTLESRQAEGYENFRKLQELEEIRKKRNEKLEAIKKARDTAKRFSRLEGKGLADGDDEDLNVKSWLMKQKKRQKQIEKARKLENDLAEAEMTAEYTAKDLSGIKVGHEISTFEEGEEQILTLKDTTIDENEEEGDELENLDLRAKEKLNETLELKKKKSVYNPLDEIESGGHSILSHYDEEIDGKKKKNFTLDSQGSILKNTMDEPSQNLNIISLDTVNIEPISDYLEVPQIKIKKVKNKVKSSRRKKVDDDDILLPIDDSITPTGLLNIRTDAPASKRQKLLDTSFIDDDDLQGSLAAQRKISLKKRQKYLSEQLVRRIRESSTNGSAEGDVNDEGCGLIIDETSEFVSNLQKPTSKDRKQRSLLRQSKPETAMSDDSDGDGDVNMEHSYITSEEALQSKAHDTAEGLASTDVTNNGLEAEATLDCGLGSTLKLLKGRGIIKTADSGDLNAIYRQKQLFLAEKQRREADAELKARSQRERDRTNGRLDRMSAREKEEYARSQNTLRDQIESRQLAEHFNKEYKPNVELKYIDEFGRSMNKKEAFKHLSHQFHGKGSGKQKTEKMLKKIEDEKRREAQSSLDGSQIGGMSGATAQQRKKQGQAGVRLA